MHPNEVTTRVSNAFDIEAQVKGALQKRRAQLSFQRQREWILRVLSPAEGMIVDLGCGIGPLIPDLIATGRSIVGVDGSKNSVEIAQNYWGKLATIIHAQSDHLPFNDASCGAVIALGLFEYLNEPHTTLQTIHRILAPNGQLLLTIPAANAPYHRVSYGLSDLKNRLMGGEGSLVRWKPSRDEICSAFEHSGFTSPQLDRCNARIIMPPFDRIFPTLRSLDSFVEKVTHLGSTWLIQARRRGHSI